MPYIPYKRRAARGKKVYRKRYVKKATTVKKLATKVNKLTNRIKRDVEVKEYIPSSIYSGSVGQVDVNNTGMTVFQLNAMSIGAAADINSRVGNRCKIIGMSLRMQFIQQTSASYANTYIVDVWRSTDFQYSDAALRDVLYETDSISAVVDANSTRNNEVIKSKNNPTGMFTLLKSTSVYVKEDPFSASGMYKDKKLFIKLNDDLVYASAASAVPTNYRYFVCIRAQNGNRNSTTASTLSTIPVLPALTGGVVRFAMTNWFTDM